MIFFQIFELQNIEHDFKRRSQSDLSVSGRTCRQKVKKCMCRLSFSYLKQFPTSSLLSLTTSSVVKPTQKFSKSSGQTREVAGFCNSMPHFNGIIINKQNYKVTELFFRIRMFKKYICFNKIQLQKQIACSKRISAGNTSFEVNLKRS